MTFKQNYPPLLIWSPHIHEQLEFFWSMLDNFWRFAMIWFHILEIEGFSFRDFLKTVPFFQSPFPTCATDCGELNIVRSYAFLLRIVQSFVESRNLRLQRIKHPLMKSSMASAVCNSCSSLYSAFILFSWANQPKESRPHIAPQRSKGQFWSKWVQ
jgi:hypothetical protein